MKGFALGLVLKQRQKATRKWPICNCEMTIIPLRLGCCVLPHVYCALAVSRDSLNLDSSSSRNDAHLFGIPILFQEFANSTNLSQKSDFDVFSKYPFSKANLRCMCEGVKNDS